MQNESSQKVKIVTLYNEWDCKQEKYMMSLDILGQGKYGKVYKATNIDKRDHIYAVKVIQFGSSKIREEYLKELQVIKKLPKCINLVRIHPQHFESGKHFYIFQEYCPDGTLYDERVQKKKNNQPYTEQQCFDMFLQIVNGFIELRAAGIFHEDIKPQNILKCNNIYKITDFGISQLADKTELSIIRKGTLTYMPPEKLRSSKYAPTSKSEIYSLGVTLYESIFGCHPYLTKKPKDYKHYLAMIAATELKSVDELKKCFPCSSLALDKLIRTILLMLQTKQAKRLSLQELTDYVRNSQPYKSMQISEILPKSEQQAEWKSYEQICHSTVFYQTDCTEKIEDTLSSHDLPASAQTMRIYFELFREISAYLMQGITHCKNSKIYEFKEVDGIFKLPTTEDYLELLIVSIEKYAFSQLIKCHKKLHLPPTIQPTLKQLEADAQFTRSQYERVIAMLTIKATSNTTLTSLQIKGETANEQASAIFHKIFQQINSIRINYKDDILAIIFCKHCSEVLQYLDGALKLIDKVEKQHELKAYVQRPQYIQISQIITQFNIYQSTHQSQLQNIIQMQIKGNKQILFDLQSNSDDFEVLDFDEQFPDEI